MADRKVKVSLEATTGTFTAPLKDASAAALKLDLALKQEAATAKASAVETVKAAQQIAIAEKQAALASTQAAAAAAEGDKAQIAAKKDVTLASKELVAQERASAKQIAAAEREAAAAGKEVLVTQKAIEDQSKKTAEAYTNTGKRFLVAGAALVGAFALAEKATTAFDVALSGVAAVGGKEAVARLGELRGAALQAGKDTAFTATQAAQAEGELVKAGVSVTDVLNGGLKGALSLAAAGQLGLADAATIDANALNEFNLKGDQASHVADVLAAGANKSAADVGQLATGMEQSGLVAAQLGLSLEDTTATLSAFADRGLKGADAGTSLKTMLERLAAPTGAAADQMKTLGISAYDANGKFVGITSVAGQLKDRLGSLSEAQRNQALQTIFGSDAIRAATVLYNLGSQGMQGYVDSVNDSGAASRMAGAQMNNLGGDLKQLKGSIDVALIQGGSGGNDVLREMTQNATKAVNAFASMPKPLQEVAVGLAGGGGASLLLVGGLTTVAGKVGTVRKTLGELEATADGAKGALAKAGTFLTGPWGLALAGAATVAGIFISKMGSAKIQVADFTSAIKEDSNALGANTTAAVSADLASKGLYDSFGKIGVSMDTVTKAAMGNADALHDVETASAKALKNTGNVGEQAALAKNLDIIEATSAALHDQQHAQLQSTAATQEAAAAGTDDAAVQARLAQSAKEAAGGTMQRTAAARAAAEAARADASGTNAATAAVKGSTGASKSSTAATKADEAAKKAHTAAQKAAARAAQDAAKASSADAKASTAAANAADKGSYANSSAAGAAKSAAQATKDKTRAQSADTTASNAAERAAKAAAKAHDADARATASHAKAASGDAQAQADAAEAAREAAFEHQIGAEALKGWAAAAKDTSHSTDVLDDSVSAEVDAMKSAQEQANGLKDALDALNGIHISAGRAAVDVQNKIADLTKALHDNGKQLDITTQAGRDNMQAIYDTADAINAHAEAVTQETGSVDAGNQALQASKKEFDKVLTAAGVSKDAIQQFNDELLAIPSTKPVTIEVDSKQALAELRQFKDAAGNLTAIHIGGTTGRAGLATGGRVTGPGTTTSDSVPTNLSRDEYVIKASAASRIGYAELDRLNFGGGIPTMVRPQYVAAVGGTTPHHAAAAATVGAPQLVLMPGADSAVATMINKLINTGQLVIKR